MNTKAKKSGLRIIILIVFAVIIIFMVIPILIWAKVGVAGSHTVAAPSAKVASFASDYDTRLPNVPVSEMVSDGWPSEIAFNREYDDTLCGELDHADYKAIYIDSEKYLRITKSATVEVSYDKGVKWQIYERNTVSKENFQYWLAVHESPSMAEYSVCEILDQLDKGAKVIYASFSNGNEIYFVIGEAGTYLIQYMPNKIYDISMDGQRMAISSRLNDSQQQEISNGMLKSFYGLLVSTGIISQEKADQDYTVKMQWFRNHNKIFSIVD